MSRGWSEAEHDRAEKIAHIIAQCSNPLVGAVSLARGLGLSIARTERDKSRRLVYIVMPLVQELVPEMYPGTALNIDEDGVYAITRGAPSRAAVKHAIARGKKAFTAGGRAVRELAHAPQGTPEALLRDFYAANLGPQQEQVRAQIEAMIDNSGEQLKAQQA